ncbi:MAG: pre-peptidase C-terminal domain-containing protein [Planctomycetaceae bacterium]|nr:pre-peptidase C-terminal domain-containing protein [Planctomycetaceae bacterium]
MQRSTGWILLAVVVISATDLRQAEAQPAAPAYEDLRLDGIYPSGGQAGTTVTVEFRGHGIGLQDPKDIVIDGPPGISVKELKPPVNGVVVGTLDIAADARPGRRWLRVLNERSGLTNFAYFQVGRLPEHLEKEPNNELNAGEPVAAPCVVNGRINPQADVDVFRFSARAGQHFVAAIAAHSLDIHGQYKSYGIADFALEILDTAGQTLATAEDTIGFDPVIEFTPPRDGDYLVRVTLLNFGGFPEGVYRLTLGEVPYVVGAFPSGVRRGVESEIELFGPNIPAGTKQKLLVPKDVTYPMTHVVYEGAPTAGTDVPLAVGDLAETTEAEPNADREHAQAVALESTVNARFQEAGDADWYRVTLAAKQRVWFDVTAQRFSRSPVDTLLQVYDAQGKLLTENDDDAFDPSYESYHDYRTTDSRLHFEAVAAGDYFVRISEQAGSGGPRAVYRFSVSDGAPDFRVVHFPDSIPVWGPGTTAAVLVKVERHGDFQEDVEVSIEGLPEGWKSTKAISLKRTPERFYNYYQLKTFLTVTAPADAKPGTAFPIRIVGRSVRDGKPLEHVSWPLNLFYTTDIGFFRISPQSRVAVARPQGPWLEAITTEITGKPGETVRAQVRVHNAENLKEMPIVVSMATVGVACGFVAPKNTPIIDGKCDVAVLIPNEMPVGTFYCTIAQTWRSDVRTGVPGPCTPLLKLTVQPKPK